MADLPSVNQAQIELLREAAHSDADGPVFMLNLNKYTPEAGYPDGQLYTDYMSVLATLLTPLEGESRLGARSLTRTGASTP